MQDQETYKRIIRVVVASPQDVQAERRSVDEVVQEVNRGIATAANIHVVVTRWETDSYPGFHPDGPQGLIDETIDIAGCDLLIGIFWKRLGTPGADGQTGTEHEFHTAYDSWKKRGRPQVMVYFNQRPYTPGKQEEMCQHMRVLGFQEDFPEEGLWWCYKNPTHFKELIREHVTRFILQQTGALQASSDVQQSSKTEANSNCDMRPVDARSYGRSKKGSWVSGRSRGFRSLLIAMVVASILLGVHLTWRSHIPDWMSVLESIDVPMLVWDERVELQYANSAAQRFYNQDSAAMSGKNPNQLHEWAKPYMLNYREWVTEQMDRNARARQGTLSSKSNTPMHMSKHHCFGEQTWYLTSKPFCVNGRRYLITRFSREAGEP